MLLSGKTILVTRATGQAAEFGQLLRAQGAAVVEMPVLAIYPPSSWEPLDRAIAQLAEFDWLILTSTNAVDYFFERLELQASRQALAGVKIAVVGQKTAARLQPYGIQPDFTPPDFIADELVNTFPETDLDKTTMLFPRVETGGREVLVQAFRARGAIVTEVAAYESGCVATIDPTILERLQQGTIDVISFASSKTVRCFYKLIQTSHPPSVPRWIKTICLASIGPQTSAACQQWLGRVDIEAQTYTLEGLTEAIVQWAQSPSPLGGQDAHPTSKQI